MRKNKLKIILVLTLICTLALSAPISVSAKTKTIGKPKDISSCTYFGNSNSNQGMVYLYASSKNAKKCEFYRATSLNGKYKKFATTKNEDSIYKGAKNGLSYYKVRGINGKKKGKFSSKFVSYKTDMSITSYKPNYSDNSITVTYFVDNSTGNCDMKFINSDNNMIETKYIMTDAERKQLYSDKKLYYDEDGDAYWIDEDEDENYVFLEQYQTFYGNLVDEKNNEISSITVPKKATAYVSVKYFLYVNEEDTANASTQMKFAVSAIDRSVNGNNSGYEDYNCDYTIVYQDVKIKSYKFQANLCYEDEMIEGYLIR